MATRLVPGAVVEYAGSRYRVRRPLGPDAVLLASDAGAVVSASPLHVTAVVDAAPATKHVLGSNHVRVFVHHDDRTGRILAIGVIDNLVKGAAGQAIQAFNVVHGLAETAGLEQLPLAP